MKYFLFIIIMISCTSCSQSIYYQSMDEGGYSTIEITPKKEVILRLSGNIFLPTNNRIEYSYIYCPDCVIKKNKGKVEEISFSLTNCAITQIGSKGIVNSNVNSQFYLTRWNDINPLFVFYETQEENNSSLVLSNNIRFSGRDDLKDFSFSVFPRWFEKTDSIEYIHYPSSVREYNLRDPWIGWDKDFLRMAKSNSF